MTLPVFPNPEVSVEIPIGHPWYRRLKERIEGQQRCHAMLLFEGTAQMFQLAEANEAFSPTTPPIIETTWRASAAPFQPEKASSRQKAKKR